MAETTTLVLDIKDRLVAGILILQTKRSQKVLMAHCCYISGEKTIRGCIAEVVEFCKAGGSRCLVAMGAEHFHFRSFHLPFTDRKKARAVIPFEIEDAVSFNEQEFLFDYLLQPNPAGGTDVLAAIVKKEVVRDWLSLLEEFDLDPELITLSGLQAALSLIRQQEDTVPSQGLLNVGFSKATLFYIENEKIAAVRSIPYNTRRQAGFVWSSKKRTIVPSNPKQAEDEFASLAGDVENTLFAIALPGEQGQATALSLCGPVGLLPPFKKKLEQELQRELHEATRPDSLELAGLERMAERWPRGMLDDAIALATASKKEREQLNFRTGDLSHHGGVSNLPNYAKGALAAVLLLALGLVFYQLFDYQHMKNQRNQLDRQLVAMYQQTIPGATPGPEPVKELQVRVNTLKETTSIDTRQDQNATTVKLLADISARIPSTIEVSLERFIYDRKVIRLSGVTDNFNSVDLMKKALEQSPSFSSVTIGSANVDPKAKGVKFELKLQL